MNITFYNLIFVQLLINILGFITIGLCLNELRKKVIKIDSLNALMFHVIKKYYPYDVFDSYKKESEGKLNDK